jgi:hypothetical protein
VPGIRVGDYIVLSGMGPTDPHTGERSHGARCGTGSQNGCGLECVAGGYSLCSVPISNGSSAKSVRLGA